MAERDNDEILQLAEQGNLQALSVYLNRHLIPNGAHVKVKQKEESLHVLVIVVQDSENTKLIQTVQQLLTQLRPSRIKRVKVYTQVLGQKQANLQQQFGLATSGAAISSRAINMPPASFEAAKTNTAPPPVPSSFASSAFVQPPVNPPESKTTLPTVSHEPRRYSVLEFLSRVTNIEEIKVLQKHPFFTGSCPRCSYQFPSAKAAPTYWDCPSCGWQDDLGSVMPARELTPSSQQTSLTESKRLGDYLIEAGLLTQSQIEVALSDQLTTSLRFGEILVRRGWIKEETIEYLMQKVILPERNGALQNAASYLDSSRNLLKTLLQNQAAAPQLPTKAAPAPQVKPQQVKPQPKVDKEPIEPPVVQKPVAPVPSGKLANERETLILPDIDLEEYLKGA